MKGREVAAWIWEIAHKWEWWNEPKYCLVLGRVVFVKVAVIARFEEQKQLQEGLVVELIVSGKSGELQEVGKVEMCVAFAIHTDGDEKGAIPMDQDGRYCDCLGSKHSWSPNDIEVSDT